MGNVLIFMTFSVGKVLFYNQMLNFSHNDMLISVNTVFCNFSCKVLLDVHHFLKQQIILFP